MDMLVVLPLSFERNIQHFHSVAWKSFTQTQQNEAQLKVVKGGEVNSAKILYSQRTPTEVRRQTKKGSFQDHQNTNNRKKKLEATHIKLPTEKIVIGTRNAALLINAGNKRN